MGVVIEFLSHGEFAEIIFGHRSVAGEHESLLITSDCDFKSEKRRPFNDSQVFNLFQGQIRFYECSCVA